MADNLVDEAAKESSPASDPPAFTGAAPSASTARPTSAEVKPLTDLQAFDLLLVAMERSLLTPIVSGELEHWGKVACQSMQDALPAIHHRLRVEYPQEIKAILQDDAELSTQATQLFSDVDKISAEAQSLESDMKVLCSFSGQHEPDEAPVSAVAQRLAERGVLLGTVLRRLDEAIRTWQNEALNRDRGTGD